MISLARRFFVLPFLLKVIWTFCLLGALLNMVFIGRDLQGNGILLRLHIGFFILYAGQVAFILLQERMVWILSLLQAFLAFLSNLDFTFVPVGRVVGYLVYGFYGSFSLEAMEVYKYVFVSFCLTLELLKTWLLFALLPAPKKKKDLSNSLYFLIIHLQNI